jgi:hypothetical protein
MLYLLPMLTPTENLTWFTEDFKTLKRSSDVNTTVHITSHTLDSSNAAPQIAPPAPTTSCRANPQPVADQPLAAITEKEEEAFRSIANDAYIGQDTEKHALTHITVESASTTPVNSSRENMEKTSSTESLVAVHTAPPPSGVDITAEDRPSPRSQTINWRPDVRKLIGLELENTDRRLSGEVKPNGRVLVVACGPRSMISDVQGAVASWVATGEGVGVELLVEGFGW